MTTFVAAASECPRQRLLGHAHAIGLGRVETDDAAIDRLRDRPLELALVNSTVGAALSQHPKPTCGHLQAGSRPNCLNSIGASLIAPAMAADGVAKGAVPCRGGSATPRCRGHATSTQRTTAPAAMVALEWHLVRESDRQAPPQQGCARRGTSLPQTVYPPSPSSVSHGLQRPLGDGYDIAAPATCLAGSARRAAPAASTEMPSSSPIKW